MTALTKYRNGNEWPTLWLDDYFDRLIPGRTQMVPKANVKKYDDKVVIEMEVPHFSKDDISISSEGNVITIKGEKKSEEKEEFTYLYKEIENKSFVRSWRIDSNFIADEIKAVMKNGLLNVSVPLKEKKAIDISIE